ncbi:MAG TPA: hypothetical protein VHB68_06540, partial [Steroidobacteraceae bacterium]|nr:hypothetical protein [Steroidobacteraceae bacterium]
ENFCETGKQFDAQLATLGATPLQPRVDCDVDFEVPAGAWIDAIVDRLATLRSAITPPRSVAFAEHRSASISNAYTRKNPFNAPVLLNQRLTARGSTKDVRHIELSLTGSNMHYEPGDAIGIVPHNDAAQVDALLQALPFAANAPVVVESREVSLHDSLRDRYDIGLLSQAFLERYASAVTDTGLPELLKKQSPEVLQRLIAERTLIDLVREHPPLGLDAGAFARLLRPLAPRLYSIASSMRTAPDEVHLTVSVVEYASSSGSRRGVVSGFLADLASDAATAPIYLHRNPGFRLPDSDRPIIMIGPGTGVAPFRAFVAERAAVNARGRNWLFFGDRSFETDFLYQSEWLDWRKRGVLTRFDVAFSRDQREKSYVQHRMREHGAQLWAWLEEGAHLYVCGDAQRMAVDVHDTLLEITKQHGGRSDEGAGEYLLQLQREHRYQRDVY